MTELTEKQLQEGRQGQQNLKDMLCLLIQREDVLVLQVDFNSVEDGCPTSITIQYKENVEFA